MGVFGDIGGGLGGIVGGIFGNKSLNNAYGKAREQYRLGLDTLLGADVQGQDGWSNYVEDGAGREAQLHALSGLKNLSMGQDGMDVSGRVAFDQGAQRIRQQQKAQVDSAKANLAMKGTDNGGQGEFAAALSAGQGGANGLADYGAQSVAEGQNRKLGALQMLQQGGTQFRASDLASQSKKRDAANLMSMFNAGQRWNKAQGVNSQYNNVGNSYVGQGDANNKFATGLGASIGKTAGGVADAFTGGWMTDLTKGVGGGAVDPNEIKPPKEV